VVIHPRRPIGPAVGFCCQFLAMPGISYLLGYLLLEVLQRLWTNPTTRASTRGWACCSWAVAPGGSAPTSGRPCWEVGLPIP